MNLSPEDALVMTRRSPIVAQISGSETASAVGLTVRSSSPIIALCRKLLERGHDPATPLEAYRGPTLALTVRSIGEGARLRVRRGGGFEIDPSFAPTAPAVRRSRR